MESSEKIDFENVSEAKLADLLEDFLKGFSAIDGDRKYRSLISLMPSQQRTWIEVDFEDLSSYSGYGTDLAARILTHPRVTLRAFSRAAQRALEIENPQYAYQIREKINVRVKGIYDFDKIETVGEKIIGRFISLKGIITKRTAKIPRMTIAAYKCQNEHLNFIYGPPPEHPTDKPLNCEHIGCTSKIFNFDIENSKFVEWRIARIQEMPEDLSAAELPEGYDVDLIEDLVDLVTPGDRIIVNCIPIREEVKPASNPKRFRYRLFAKYVDVISKRPEEIEITQDEQDRIKTISSNMGTRDRLIQSMAPSILGHEMHKEVILLSLVGAPSQKTKDERIIRGDIHILLCGDPGLAKSELLKYTHENIALRSVWASGKGSTAAGLGAAVVPESDHTWSLEAGAAVWADLGTLMLDELDKLPAEHRDTLHDIMEQQWTIVNKAGIHATLMTRCSVIATMNPVSGKWDPYKNLMDNISLPASLVSRFDIIFTVRDEPDPSKDGLMADHTGMLYGVDTGVKEPIAQIDAEMLRKYIAYAKKIDPKLTREAMNRIRDYYISTRASTSQDPNMIPVTPRWLLATIRLTLAEARLMLHERTTEDDALRAVRIMQRMLETIAVDKNTGKIDPGVLYGHPVSERMLFEASLKLFHDLEGTGVQKTAVEDEVFYDEFVKRGTGSKEQAESTFRTLYRSGQIYEVSKHHFRRI